MIVRSMLLRHGCSVKGMLPNKEPKTRLQEFESISALQAAAKKNLVSGTKAKSRPELGHSQEQPLLTSWPICCPCPPPGLSLGTIQMQTTPMLLPSPTPTPREGMPSHRQRVTPDVGPISFILTAMVRL